MVGSSSAHLHDFLCLFVNVWVYEGHVIVARNAVAQGRQPLIYPLDNNLIRQAVADVLQLLCEQHHTHA
jgi:hypothetical protein